MSVIAQLLSLALLSSPSGGYVGNRACAPCHEDLFRSYSATPMALSSGKVRSETVPAQSSGDGFTHEASRARYRIAKEPAGYFLEFARASSTPSEAALRGRRLLSYFIGSGAAGRSYLFSVDGFLFQAPVTYYSRLNRWDMSPGFERYDHVNLTRPIETNCLECHASNIQAVAGTQNRYAEPPFLQDGIGCERCHGPGEKHVQTMSGKARPGRSEIINPAKLDTRRRDSICEQCHLTGEARIARPGRSLSMFRPGDLLSDFVVSFVSRESVAGLTAPVSLTASVSLTATSHVEKFWQSRCKKESGDRLWCGTCHNSHEVPEAGAKNEYFRKKCLGCHQLSTCTASAGLRAASKDDCAGCHMPKNRVVDGGHGVLTDHSIARTTRLVVPGREARAPAALVPFRGTEAGEREHGLAHAEVAASLGDRAYSSRAFELLERVMKNAPKDSAVLYRLAFFYDQKGDAEQAARLYERALEIDPSLVVAKVNLANHHARKGNLQQALRLWQDALARNPALEEARLNLAMAYAQAGDTAAARTALLKALEFNPDSPLARRLLADLR